MSCPLHSKSCRQVYYSPFPAGGWFCFGVTKRDKKLPEVPKYDVCRHCFKSTSHHGKVARHYMRPEEALITAAGLTEAARAWLDAFPDYEVWLGENDR